VQITIEGPYTNEGVTKTDALLEVTGDITQAATGLTRMYIAGPVRGETYSAIDCGRSINLDGGIQIVLRPELFGYLPRVGDTFDVMTSIDGITLTDGSIDLTTMMTVAGAAQLGITLPAYATPYALDPDALVVFPTSLFSYSIVNAGRTLRLTLISPICAPSVGPVAAVACASGSAPFSVTPNGSGPFSYQWQVQNAAGAWINLGTGPVALACLPGGSAQASATTPTASSTSVAIVPCPSNPGQPIDVQRFAVRALITSDCGTNPSPSSLLSVCTADFNCDNGRNVDDIFVYLSGWFSGDPRCDVNNFAGVNVDDIFIFLSLWFAGC